jgi:hypothetical protein
MAQALNVGPQSGPVGASSLRFAGPRSGRAGPTIPWMAQARSRTATRMGRGRRHSTRRERRWRPDPDRPSPSREPDEVAPV